MLERRGAQTVVASLQIPAISQLGSPESRIGLCMMSTGYEKSQQGVVLPRPAHWNDGSNMRVLTGGRR